MGIPLERIEDEEWQEDGFYVRITVQPEEIKDEETRKLAERVVAALRYEPPVKPGTAFAIAASKLACPVCKGKGTFFDCEDEEMIACNRCDSTGLNQKVTM